MVKIKKKNTIIFLRNSKIFFRPFEVGDITETYQRNLNELNTLGINIVFPKNKKNLNDYYNNSKINQNTILFTICNYKNKKNIGTASLSQINWVNRNACFGRLIFSEFRNKGYGTEVVNLLKEYAFNYLNLKSLWTFVFSSNIASIKSNKKAGGKVCGELKNHVFKKNRYYNSSLIQHIKK